MNAFRRWLRREFPTHAEEARAQLVKASQLERHADRLIEHDRRLIRDNNFAPKVARALREGTQ